MTHETEVVLFLVTKGTGNICVCSWVPEDDKKQRQHLQETHPVECKKSPTLSHVQWHALGSTKNVVECTELSTSFIGLRPLKVHYQQYSNQQIYRFSHNTISELSTVI